MRADVEMGRAFGRLGISTDMQAWKNLLLAIVTLAFSLPSLWAQDLAPRAYVITLLHSNAIIVTYSFYSGIQFDGALPVNDATAKVNVPVLTFYHSLSVLGRSANITASLPYGVGHLQGALEGTERRLYRSGLLDSVFRFSVNLRGGPAMDAQEMRKWHYKLLIGASFKVVAPTGQYDPTKLINYGANRWALKPEIGLSRRWGHWLLDAYGGAWFFTTNHEYFPGKVTQTESPIGSFEGRLSYDVKPRLWASLDANFWTGGSTSLNGVENSLTHQKNSRIGGTVSLPVNKHQALKVSYNRGAYIRFGGNSNNVSMAWQYSG
jgi:hypothetical protein